MGINSITNNKIFRNTTIALIITLLIILLIPSKALAFEREELHDFIRSGSFGQHQVTAIIIEQIMQAAGDSDPTGIYAQWEINRLANALTARARSMNGVAEGTSIPGLTSALRHGDHFSDTELSSLRQTVTTHFQRQQVRSGINTISIDFNLAADVEAAGVALSGFIDLLSFLVGIIAMLVVAGASFFTAVDILFLTFPPFRGFIEEKTGGKDNQYKLGGIRMVSDEAIIAMKRSDIGNMDTDKFQGALGVYLKERIWAFILIAIVIYILLTGNIDLIVGAILNFISGIIGALLQLGA